LFSKFRVHNFGNKQTDDAPINGQVDNITPLLASLAA